MSSATAAQLSGPQQSAGQGGNTAVVAPAPFVRGSRRHTEQFMDVSNALGVNPVQLPIADVPAHGFLASIVLTVEVTGGTGTAAVYKEDAPWSVIQEVKLADVGGAPIVGPISGYDLYLLHKYGGGAGHIDPTRNPGYSAPSTAGNWSASLRIPVEISSRDALGCLPNQNANSTYKLHVTQAGRGDVYSTPAEGSPVVRIVAHLEAWSQPPATDLMGRPISQFPPGLGTTQFVSKATFQLGAGQNNIRSQRVGNLIRNTILVYRVSGARSTAAFPDPLACYIDSRHEFTQSKHLLRMKMAERSLVSSLDTGVIVLSNMDDWDGIDGGEMRDQWLPTNQGTRYELQGSWGNAGSLHILTQDIAAVGDPYIG